MKPTGMLLLTAAATMLLIGFAAGHNATPPPGEPVAAQRGKSKVSKFMRAKLAASQNVLDGLVTEDFTKIQKGAEKMVLMSKAADWQVIQGPTYAQYSSEFRRSAERLAKQAKDKKLDSAALSYMHVTMTCISCHKYVKNARIAQGEPLSPGLQYALELDRTRRVGIQKPRSRD